MEVLSKAYPRGTGFHLNRLSRRQTPLELFPQRSSNTSDSAINFRAFSFFFFFSEFQFVSGGSWTSQIEKIVFRPKNEQNWIKNNFKEWLKRQKFEFAVFTDEPKAVKEEIEGI